MRKKNEPNNVSTIEQPVRNEDPTEVLEQEIKLESGTPQEEQQEDPQLVLRNEIERLQKENAELIERIKYSQAELVGYRMRKDEETASLLKYANQDLILELLPVVDNFERAMALADKSNAELTKFLNGFNMLYVAIKDIFTKFGVEEISEVGVMFDPTKHQALLVEENKDKENDTVLEILLKGYILKGRVIRPASVKVNKIN